MSSSDSSPNKGFFSDGENEAKYKRYVSINKKLLDDKLSKVNFCTDVPFSMSNGDLFQKFSVEYMKNIIFLKKGKIYSENVRFNFFNYLQLFTGLNYTKRQKYLFEKIVNFQEKEDNKNSYFPIGDFDLIVYDIKGEDILASLSRNKFNFYQYPGKEIIKDKFYSIISEIKLDFFSQIKYKQTQIQFKKYKDVLELLVSEPNLGKLKKTIGLKEDNDIIFMMATNGNYYQFDYMKYTKLYSDENYKTDVEKKYRIPFHLKFIEEISDLNIPVLLLFVPKTLDDNGKIYKNKYVLELNKKIDDLNDHIKILNEKVSVMENEIKELKKQLENKKNEDILRNLMQKKDGKKIINKLFIDFLKSEKGKIAIENIFRNLLLQEPNNEIKEELLINKKMKRSKNH